MSLIFFVFLLGIFWQPLYLAGMGIFYSFKQDTVNSAKYHSLVMPWFKKLVPLVFSSPTAFSPVIDSSPVPPVIKTSV